MPTKLIILGSTGSIGQSTLDVLREHPDSFEVVALIAHSKAELLAEQCREFKPFYAGLIDETVMPELAKALSAQKIEFVSGVDEVLSLIELGSVDMVVNAIVGAAGLQASLRAIECGKQLALANKESLVAGGPLFAKALKAEPPVILPIDSEHSAIWQSLRAGHRKELKKIILTASGGPFRTLPKSDFDKITVEQALDHPTWNMGAKITIDSSTLANKGLEVIEAVVLFGITPDQLEVVVHPQSIIHSMVEFVDSSVIAQLSLPDMRLPISYALFYPERIRSDFGQITWREMADLTFEEPDLERFDALKLAFEVARTGGTAPAVFNAANEIAVEAFLKRKISFVAIPQTVRQTVESVEMVARPELDDILDADRIARERAKEYTESLTCS